jgi:thiamine biosynthesis protein ThiS
LLKRTDVFQKKAAYAAFFIKGTCMQISVNGEVERIEPQSLESYLTTKSLLGRRIAVERNGDIVPKSQFSEVILEDGDVLEIVHAIGGG